MSLLETMKAEKAKLEKQLEQFKPDPAITARISALKEELSKLNASVSGSEIKSQIAALDKAIGAIENPGRVTRPMSEAGKAAIKAGLQRYHQNRKKTTQTPAAAPTAHAAPSGERPNVAPPTKK